MNDWIGKTLGKVQIESLIARGGMAEIYLGTHTTLQRRVAVKILREQYEDDPELLERFRREAVVVSRLRHPNIVQIYDFDAADGHPYIVMEYISGPSLSRYLDTLHGKGKRLELPVISRLLTSIASALEYAHKMGVVHRDVKPGNILLTAPTSQMVSGITVPAAFEPILTDFGLVRFLNSSRHTTNGQITGTPAYMSPEQARGEATDERTDIYSLGVVLYEMLSGGRVPFEGETTMSVLLSHIHHPIDPIPGLHPSLQDILDLALAKDRQKRYSSSTRFASDFRTEVELLARVGSHVPASRTSSPTQNGEKRRVPVWRTAVFATLAIAIGSLIWLGRIQTQQAGIIPNTGTTPLRTALPSLTAPAGLDSSAVLRFRNGTAIADQAELIVQSIPRPPDGSRYEAWLIGGETRQSLGILELDQQGNGRIAYSDSSGENLIGLYDSAELSIEGITDAEPGMPGEVVYAFAPSERYSHIRNLLSFYSETPDGISIFQGLLTTIYRIQQYAADMKADYANGDEPAMRHKAEAIMNLLVGNKSPDFKDWDGDAQRADPFDGYGLLQNGSQPGYLKVLSSELSYASDDRDTPANNIGRGEDARHCTRNLSTWANALRHTTLEILSAPSSSDLDPQIADADKFASQLLMGTDLDGDQAVELLPGECGATSLLEHTFRLAEMPLLPLRSIPTSTPHQSEQ